MSPTSARERARRLRFSPECLTALPFQVLESAFWRPQAAKLHGRYKASLAEIAADRVTKTPERLRVAWSREETWINHSLSTLLMALPSSLLSALMAEVIGFRCRDEAVVSRLDTPFRKLTGFPDFVVADSAACVLGESKVAAHSKSHKYSFQQFSKYMTLGAICECATNPEISRRTAHLLLVPTLDAREFCSDWEAWRPQVKEGRLVVQAEDVRQRSEEISEVPGNFDDWRAHLASTLLSKQVTRHSDIDERKVAQFAAVGDPVVVPTFVRTWGALLGSVRKLCVAGDMKGHARAAAMLEQLAVPEKSV